VVPVVFLMYDPGLRAALSELYDAGVRKGDKVALAVGVLPPKTIESAPEDIRHKVSDILDG
jgi:hypothetical protein